MVGTKFYKYNSLKSIYCLEIFSCCAAISLVALSLLLFRIVVRAVGLLCDGGEKFARNIAPRRGVPHENALWLFGRITIHNRRDV